MGDGRWGDGDGMGWVVRLTIECPIGPARYDVYVKCVCEYVSIAVHTHVSDHASPGGPNLIDDQIILR